MTRQTVALQCHKIKSEVTYQERALLCRAVGLLKLIADDGIDDEIRAVVSNVNQDFKSIVCRELR